MWSVGQGLHMPVGMSSFLGTDVTILFNFNFFLLATLGNLDFLPLSLGGGGGGRGERVPNTPVSFPPYLAKN